MISYRFEIVGGSYDGVPGLSWSDDGDHPPPDAILIGICPGDGACVADVEYCQRKSDGKRHPAYWLPEEGERPVKTMRYEKQDSYVERREFLDGTTLDGRAVYAIGGLLLPSIHAEAWADLSERGVTPREKVPA